MSYLDDAIGDSGCTYLGAYERATYTDKWTVQEVQLRLGNLADKARRGQGPREQIAFDPGPTDGVIRQQLTDAIIAAQKLASHAATDGKIDDWLISALGMQPHAPVDDKKPAATEIPNPAKQSKPAAKDKPKSPAPEPLPQPATDESMSTPAKVGLALGGALLLSLAMKKRKRTP